MLTLNLNILWTVVNILVLFVLLRKFLYRPVMNVIEQRQKQIDDAIADAEGKKNDAQAVLAQDRKSTRLNSSHRCTSRMPSSA